MNSWMKYALGFISFFAIFTSALGAQEIPTAPAMEDQVWVHIAFREINSASPVVGEATFPVTLALKIIDALPQKTLDECKEEGFDIPAISKKIQSQNVGEVFEQTQKDYQLITGKVLIPVPTNQYAGYLSIATAKFPLKVPLSITSMTVKLLQLAFNDLQGMDEELAAVVEEVKKTPPALLLYGEDKLMESWLKIALE